MMSEPILTVFNRHSANCGQPPAYDTREKDKYFGYFQSESGEQWLFVYDRTTKRAILKGGDVDWASEAEMTSPKPPYVLGEAEQKWLQACWHAATGETSSLDMSALIQAMARVMPKR